MSQQIVSMQQLQLQILQLHFCHVGVTDVRYDCSDKAEATRQGVYLSHLCRQATQTEPSSKVQTNHEDMHKHPQRALSLDMSDKISAPR